MVGKTKTFFLLEFGRYDAFVFVFFEKKISSCYQNLNWFENHFVQYKNWSEGMTVCD